MRFICSSASLPRCFIWYKKSKISINNCQLHAHARTWPTFGWQMIQRDWMYLSFRYRIAQRSIDDKFMMPMPWSNNKYLEAAQQQATERNNNSAAGRGGDGGGNEKGKSVHILRPESSSSFFPSALHSMNRAENIFPATTKREGKSAPPRIQMKNCSPRRNSTNKCFEK